MHYSFTFALAAFIISTASALNIIVNNDDSWGSANIREFYRLLKTKGHDVYLVAPSDAQSGQGGRTVFTESATLSKESAFGLLKAGAPSFGTDPADSHIWYYNGTPAATTFFALDYVVPKYTKWSKVDLLVAGPNFGNNLGPFLYTLSGTIGATYSAVERGIPAIAFSAGNEEQRSYKWINATTKSGYPDPATIDAQLSVDLVQQLIANAGKKDRLLPLGYGLNVNYPEITSLTNSSCVKPPFIQTRFTGGAIVDKAVFNESSKVFTFGDTEADGANTCINGDCKLPGETAVVDSGCYSSVSVFTVDYDAPNCHGSKNVRPLLQPLVEFKKPENKGKQARGLKAVEFSA